MRLLLAAVLSIAAAAPAVADEVWLTMDQVRPFDIARPAGQIIIGNPAIADVTVQDSSRILLFGKAPGLTNIYLFDDEGVEIDNLVVRVKSNTIGMLTFHRGSSRTTYNCFTNCDATLTVGDSQASFGEVSTQVQQKFEQARSSAGNN